MSGDLGDNRLCIVILEHWRAALLGQASAGDPNFYYPLTHVLGFSEALVLFAAPYNVFRALGLDRYLAYQACLILFKLIGFLSFYLLLFDGLRCRVRISLFGAAVFALSSMYGSCLGHGQLISVCVLPLIVWLLIQAWRKNRGKQRGRLLASALAGCLLGSVLLTSYYVAFFALLFTALAFVLWSLNWLRVRTGSLSGGVKAAIGEAAPLVLPAGICFLFFVAAAAWLYLPVLDRYGGRSIEEVRTQTLLPSQILNPGTSNLAWGGAILSFPRFFQVNFPRETGRGWTPVLFGCFLFFTAQALMRREFRGLLGLLVIVLALAATSIAGLHPWQVVHDYWPGAAGIRVPGRINLVLNLVVVAFVADGVRRWFDRFAVTGVSVRQVQLALLCSVLVLEQLNPNAFPGYSRSEELALWRRVPAPPVDCRTFYAVRSPRGALDHRHIDAMLAARQWGIPTINGYSGIVPAGGGCPDEEAACRDRIAQWVRSHHLENGLCELDFQAMVWKNTGSVAGK